MDELSSKPDKTAVTGEDRLREVVELGLLTPETDEILGAVAAEAATRLGLPISLVSIVHDESQFFAASHGLNGWLDNARHRAGKVFLLRCRPQRKAGRG